MAQKTTPANRSEEEIAGYRDVLATIHASHEHVKVRPSVILQLHRDLYKFSPERGGHWKQVDNEIADVHADGTRTTRFNCVAAMLTAEWVELLGPPDAHLDNASVISWPFPGASSLAWSPKCTTIFSQAGSLSGAILSVAFFPSAETLSSIVSAPKGVPRPFTRVVIPACSHS